MRLKILIARVLRRLLDPQLAAKTIAEAPSLTRHDAGLAIRIEAPVAGRWIWTGTRWISDGGALD